MDVKAGLWRKLSAEELILLNCGVGEDFWESSGLQGDPKGNKSILKELSPEYSLEGLMLKLKLQYFSHLMQKNGLIEKDPAAGIDGMQKGMTEDEMVGWHHQLNGCEFE